MQVQRKNVVEIGKPDLAEQLRPDKSDIVDDTVEGMAPDEVLQHGCRLVAISQIDRHELARKVASITGETHHMVAAAHEPIRQGMADALAGARNEEGSLVAIMLSQLFSKAPPSQAPSLAAG
jgi:hypothetical protein